MNEAIQWFGDILGVSFRTPERMITQQRVDPGEFGDEEPHEGVSYLAWSVEGPPYYELAEAKKGSGGLHSLEKQGLGLHHVALYVPDVEAKIGRLADHGIKLQGRVIGPNGDTMVCWAERAPETGIAVEYLDQRLFAPTQAWIETGKRPEIGGAVR
jgi:catechol 2,3-dioxygenase-like lactoylglutathione lyase family enzyme